MHSGCAAPGHRPHGDHRAFSVGKGDLWLARAPEFRPAAYYPETNVLVGIEEHAVKSRTPMLRFIEVSLEQEG